MSNSKGYLVPIDAPNPNTDERLFLHTALPMGKVLGWARDIEAKHAMFLFDSCFSGTIFKQKGLPKPPAHITAYAAKPVLVPYSFHHIYLIFILFFLLCPVKVTEKKGSNNEFQ